MKTKMNKIPSIVLASMVVANTMVPAMAQEVQNLDEHPVLTQNEDTDSVEEALKEQPMETPNQDVFLTNFTLASPDQKVFHISNTFTVSLNGYAPTNVTNKELTFESSDPNVLQVDPSGKVTCVGEGTAYIKATSKGLGEGLDTPATARTRDYIVNGAHDSGFEYQTKADGTVKIVGYQGQSKDVVIPSHIDGKTVDEIDGYKIGNNTIETLVIPEGVTTIGKESFNYCTNLRSITLPSTLTNIGDSAFRKCVFNEIVLPNSIHSIGSKALDGNYIIKANGTSLTAETLRKLGIVFTDIHVQENTAPVIHAKDRVIELHSKFDVLEGVSATDNEDQDLTKNIKVVKNDVNVDQVGVYTVIYQVTDSGNTTTVKTIQVTVQDLKKDKPQEKTDSANTGVETQVGFFAVLAIIAGALGFKLKNYKQD